MKIRNLDRYRSYKNVYRQPMMWDLPLSYLLPFGGLTLVNLLICVLTGPILGFWWVTLVQVLINFGLYFVFIALIKKYGVYFMDKLFAHYFTNTFIVVRNTRRVENILRGNKKQHE